MSGVWFWRAASSASSNSYSVPVRLLPSGRLNSAGSSLPSLDHRTQTTMSQAEGFSICGWKPASAV